MIVFNGLNDKVVCKRCGVEVKMIDGSFVLFRSGELLSDWRFVFHVIFSHEVKWSTLVTDLFLYRFVLNTLAWLLYDLLVFPVKLFCLPFWAIFEVVSMTQE